MLIGVHGKAGSGKDTSYQFIKEWAEEQGRPVRRDAFADRLKWSAARAIGFEGTLEESVEVCNQLKQPGWQIIVMEPDGVHHPITGREYLQLYGTEAHRDVFGADFWVDQVLDRHMFDELLVVTDVRFPNEAEAIRQSGGEIWQIVRPDTEIAESAHASEAPLHTHLIDRVIVNVGDLDDLRAMVRSQLNAAEMYGNSRD